MHESELKTGNFLFSESERETWKALFHLRASTVMPLLELSRQRKEIGKSLDGKVELDGHIDFLHVAAKNLEAFRELINVSQLKITALEPSFHLGDTTAAPELYVATGKIFPADGQKCERCWHWETDIGSNPEHPTICSRCVEAVKQFKA